MSLNDVVAGWDGKSVEPVLKIYDANKAEPTFGSQLVKSLGDAKVERGMTWMLKHHIEQGWRPQSAPETSLILKALSGTTHWEARLHILQCLPFLTIPTRQANPLWEYLQKAIHDDAKFVRAWSYHGLFVLASQHSRFMAPVGQILRQGLENEAAASAKVKIRQALESLGFD